MGCADSVDEELIEEARAEQKARELEKQRKREKEMRRMQSEGSGTGTSYNITATPGTEQNRSTVRKKRRKTKDQLLPGELDTIGEDDDDILVLKTGKKSQILDGNSTDLDDLRVNSKCRCMILGFEKVVSISKLQKSDIDVFDNEVQRLLEASTLFGRPGGGGERGAGTGAASISSISSSSRGIGASTGIDIIDDDEEDEPDFRRGGSLTTGGATAATSVSLSRPGSKRGYTVGDARDDLMPLPRSLSPPSMGKAYSVDTGLASAVTAQTASDSAVLSEELTGCFTRYLGGKTRIRKLCELFRFLRCDCRIRIYVVCDCLKSQTLHTLFNSVGLIEVIDPLADFDSSALPLDGSSIDGPSGMSRVATEGAVPSGASAKGTIVKKEEDPSVEIDNDNSDDDGGRSPLLSDDLVGTDSILFGDGLKKNSVVFNVIKKDGLEVDELLYLDWDASVVKYFHSIGLCRTMRVSDRHGLANATLKRLNDMFQLRSQKIKDDSGKEVKKPVSEEADE